MRLFVAVWPPADVVDTIAALPRPPAPRVRWTSPAQWHVTLRFLGQVGEEELSPLEDALAGAAASSSRCEAVVGPATGSFGRSILMVPVAGLDPLAAATVRATPSYGEPPDPRPFSGHVTLARARGGDVRPLAGVTIACRFSVDELTLVRSTTSREGATYDVLARWPLA